MRVQPQLLKVPSLADGGTIMLLIVLYGNLETERPVYCTRPVKLDRS